MAQLSLDTSSLTLSPLVPPSSRARTHSNSPISSPLSRMSNGEGPDPARLAAREASIRARMDRKRGSVASRRSVSSPLFGQSGGTAQGQALTVPMDEGTRTPRTPDLSITSDTGDETISSRRSYFSRAYSPFDVGLDRVLSTFGNSPFPSPGGFVGVGRDGARSITPTYQLQHDKGYQYDHDKDGEDVDMANLEPSNWTSYFNDPYRSPSGSPTPSRTVSSPARQMLAPPSSLGGSPMLPWVDGFATGRRGSSPNTSVRASTLTDLDDISKSLSKQSRRLSSASLLTGGSMGRRGSAQADYLMDFGPPVRRPQRLRIPSGLSEMDPDLISPTSPLSTLPRSRDSISSLMSLSTSGRATPIGVPPSGPLPMLPDKKARRKIRVRPSDTNLGEWEVDRSMSVSPISPGSSSVGLGLGFSMPEEIQPRVDRETSTTREQSRPVSMASISSGISNFSTESPEMARYRSGSFGASEILDPTAPTASVELLLPKDSTFMDLAGLIEEQDLDEGVHGVGRARRRSSRIVMDFPLPPARGLRASLETHMEEETSQPSTNSYDISLDTPDLPPCAAVRKDSLASETAWDEELGKPMSCSSFRSSVSSQTTAPSSCAQITPRSSLEGMIKSPHLRQASQDFDFQRDFLANLDDDDDLMTGDLAAMIKEVETKIPAIVHRPKSTAIASADILPTRRDRRPLPPPGPDAADPWGEPEVLLGDNDFRSILRFDEQLSKSLRQADKSHVQLTTGDRVQLPQAKPAPFAPRTPALARATGLRQPTPSRLPVSHTPTRHTSNPREVSSPMSTPRMDDRRVDRLAAFLPAALGLTRLRNTAALRAGSSVLRNVSRVGTAVSAYQYARPMWGRLTDRSSKNYEGHVPLNWFENAFLAAGSGVIGVADTSRGDLVALLSETSSQSFMPRLHASMRSEPEGRQILKDRPLISSKTVDLDYLRTLQRGTLGREWVEWLVEGGVTPDTRHEVQHIDSPVLAYTMTRYRQTHDLYHTLFSLPPTLAYELTLKVLELSNMSLPVAGLSSAFGPLRLSSARRSMWREDWMPWALRQGAHSRPLVGIYWEKRWEQGLGDLRRELGVKRMDDAAVVGRWKSYRLIREKERELRGKGEWVDEPEDW